MGRHNAGRSRTSTIRLPIAGMVLTGVILARADLRNGRLPRGERQDRLRRDGDIYRINPDGTGLQNLTNSAASGEPAVVES